MYPRAFPSPRAFCTLLTLSAMFAAVLLAGCDATRSGDPSWNGPAASPPSGLSPIDGRPIVHLRAEDLRSGTYAASIRAALASRGGAVAQARAGAGTGGVLLKDVFSASSVGGGESPSTHIVVIDGGTSQEYVLALAADEGDGGSSFGGGDVYVYMDPNVFHPLDRGGRVGRRLGDGRRGRGR